MSDSSLLARLESPVLSRIHLDFAHRGRRFTLPFFVDGGSLHREEEPGGEVVVRVLDAEGQVVHPFRSLSLTPLDGTAEADAFARAHLLAERLDEVGEALSRELRAQLAVHEDSLGEEPGGQFPRSVRFQGHSRPLPFSMQVQVEPEREWTDARWTVRVQVLDSEGVLVRQMKEAVSGEVERVLDESFRFVQEVRDELAATVRASRAASEVSPVRLTKEEGEAVEHIAAAIALSSGSSYPLSYGSSPASSTAHAVVLILIGSFFLSPALLFNVLGMQEMAQMVELLLAGTAPPDLFADTSTPAAEGMTLLMGRMGRLLRVMSYPMAAVCYCMALWRMHRIASGDY